MDQHRFGKLFPKGVKFEDTFFLGKIAAFKGHIRIRKRYAGTGCAPQTVGTAFGAVPPEINGGFQFQAAFQFFETLRGWMIGTPDMGVLNRREICPENS